MRIKQEVLHSITLEIKCDKEEAYEVHTKVLLIMQQNGLHRQAEYSVATSNYDSDHVSRKDIINFYALDGIHSGHSSYYGIYFRYYVTDLNQDELEALQEGLSSLQESK